MNIKGFLLQSECRKLFKYDKSGIICLFGRLKYQNLTENYKKYGNDLIDFLEETKSDCRLTYREKKMIGDVINDLIK